MTRRRRFKGRDVHGILLLDKPTGLTSNDVLQKVKRIYNAAKAGHTGALDPLATGMLPICLGEATKFSQYLLEADKRYEVTAKLGERTNTSDSDGEVVSTRPVNVAVGTLIEALDQFLVRFRLTQPLASFLDQLRTFLAEYGHRTSSAAPSCRCRPCTPRSSTTAVRSTNMPAKASRSSEKPVPSPYSSSNC